MTRGKRKKGGRPVKGREQGIFSFNAPKDLLDLLEEAKWTLRKPKGAIVVEALREYLRKHRIRGKKD